MTRLKAASFVLACILILPTVAAAPWGREEPVSFVVPPLREGDMLAYAMREVLPRKTAYGVEGVAQDTTRVILVEGASTAVDRFGVVRETTAVRMDTVLDHALVSSVRCHHAAGSAEVIRRDHLLAPSDSYDAASYSFLAPTQIETNMTLRTDFRRDCLIGKLAGRTLSEGQTLTFGELETSGSGVRPEVLGLVSLPARASEFEGRRALVFEFDVAAYAETFSRAIHPEPGDAIQFVFAEGIPALVRREIHVGGGVPNVRLLVGASRGDGAPIATDGAAFLPERNEAATFTDEAPQKLDESALQLHVPFAEAYDALLRDPTVDFARWSSEHPDATLAWAAYHEDLGFSGPEGIGPENTASWIVQYGDAGKSRAFVIEATEGLDTPAGKVIAPVRVHRVSELDASTSLGARPSRLDGASLAALLSTYGVTPGTIRSLNYFAFENPETNDGPQALLVVGQVPIFADEAQQGLSVVIDLDTGSLVEVREWIVSTESDPLIEALAEPPGVERQEPLSAFARLTAPVGTPAVAAAASATSLALLALLLKFLLVPLFTRLRRDRLLDHPVRARLFARIRDEPGIHLASLEAAEGVSRGATKHHVDQLARHRLVFLREEPGFVRCYAAGDVPFEAAPEIGALRAGSNARVYDLFRARPALSLREAARELGMSAPSVHKIKRRLERDGLLAPRTAQGNTPRGLVGVGVRKA